MCNARKKKRLRKYKKLELLFYFSDEYERVAKIDQCCGWHIQFFFKKKADSNLSNKFVMFDGITKLSSWLGCRLFLSSKWYIIWIESIANLWAHTSWSHLYFTLIAIMGIAWIGAVVWLPNFDMVNLFSMVEAAIVCVFFHQCKVIGIVVICINHIPCKTRRGRLFWMIQLGFSI